MLAERLMVGSEVGRFVNRLGGLRVIDGGRIGTEVSNFYEPSFFRSAVNSPLWRGLAFRLGGWSSWLVDGGHVEDDESNLIYIRARYYDPTSGRFLSEDPDMNGADWYVYAKNSPTNLVDQTGRDSVSPTQVDEWIEEVAKALGIRLPSWFAPNANLVASITIAIETFTLACINFTFVGVDMAFGSFWCGVGLPEMGVVNYFRATVDAVCGMVDTAICACALYNAACEIDLILLENDD